MRALANATVLSALVAAAALASSAAAQAPSDRGLQITPNPSPPSSSNSGSATNNGGASAQTSYGGLTVTPNPTPPPNSNGGAGAQSGYGGQTSKPSAPPASTATYLQVVTLPNGSFIYVPVTAPLEGGQISSVPGMPVANATNGVSGNTAVIGAQVLTGNYTTFTAAVPAEVSAWVGSTGAIYSGLPPQLAIGQNPAAGYDVLGVNTTLMADAPPSVKAWLDANVFATTGATPAGNQLVFYARAESMLLQTSSTMAQLSNLLGGQSGVYSSWSADQQAAFQKNFLDLINTDPNFAAYAKANFTTDSTYFDTLTASLQQNLQTYAEVQNNAQQVVNIYMKAQNQFQQQAALPVNVSSNGEQFVGYGENDDSDLIDQGALQSLAQVNAMSAELQAEFAQDPDIVNDTSGGVTTTAALQSIYQNYQVTPGQNGSSVIVAGTTQVNFPSDVMTVPSEQVNFPSDVMGGLDLQPALCGR